MVGTGAIEGNSTGPGQGQFQPGTNDAAQWGWPRRGGMRGFFHPGQRRMMRTGGFFPCPRGFGMPPQNFYNQQRPRPQWLPRVPRHMLFPVPQVEGYMVQQHNWIQPPPMPPPPPAATEEVPKVEESRKKKKRSCNGTSRPWDREAALRALNVEMECQKSSNTHTITIRFPDPELNKDIVSNLHPAIENVHFQAPCGPRYCFVTLDKEADVDEVMNDINKIEFGVGHLKAEKKIQKTDEQVGPENIDPFCLYVGNLPTNLSTVEVKEKFPTASRIDVGFAQKLKYTRYAFVRYETAEAALEAFKTSVNTVFASRSIIVRFRRHKAPVGPPGEKPSPGITEQKTGEKLSVGEKLKIKRDRAKLEKEKAAKDGKPKKKKFKPAPKTVESSSDEEVELENDDIESDYVTDYEEDDDDDEDKDDNDDDDDDDDYDDDDDNDDDDDTVPNGDDEDDFDDPNLQGDDVDCLDDDDDFKDGDFFKTVDEQIGSLSWRF